MNVCRASWAGRSHGEQRRLAADEQRQLVRRYGEYAQDTVMELLARHYITFVGSDAHHIRYRTPLMGDAYDLVSEQFGRSYAEAIFRTNAEQLLGIRI